MSRILLLSFVCLFTGCKVFNINKEFNTQGFENVIVYANAHPKLENTGFKNIKLKTKINILRDSILVSTTPFFGIDLGQITITNEQIKIRQKLKNKTQIITNTTFGYNIKVKQIKNALLQKKLKRDTISYKGGFGEITFTDYIYKKSVFLPQKIKFKKNTNPKNSINYIVDLDYKSIIFE